jgi:hypothetical protein
VLAGVIADGLLAPANLHDLVMAEDLLADAHDWGLGDRACWSPARAGFLADQGVCCWPAIPLGQGGRGRVCLAGWSRPGGGSRP